MKGKTMSLKIKYIQKENFPRPLNFDRDFKDSQEPLFEYSHVKYIIKIDGLKESHSSKLLQPTVK